MATSKQIKAYAKEHNCSNSEAKAYFIEQAKEKMSTVIDRGFKHSDMFDSKGHPQLIDVLEAIYDDNQQAAHDLVGGLAMDCIKNMDFLAENAENGINTKMAEIAAHDLDGNVIYEVDPCFVDVRNAGADFALMALKSFVKDWQKGKRCLLPGLSMANNTIQTTFTHMTKSMWGDPIEMQIARLKMPNGKYTTNISFNVVPNNVYKSYKQTLATDETTFPEMA